MIQGGPINTGASVSKPRASGDDPVLRANDTYGEP